jgi:hypothetical protein
MNDFEIEIERATRRLCRDIENALHEFDRNVLHYCGYKKQYEIKSECLEGFYRLYENQ